MSKQKTLILASNAGSYFYPWANDARHRVLHPKQAFEEFGFLEQFNKIVLVNGLGPQWLFHPRWKLSPLLDSYFFLWDPARCPRYAPNSETLEALKAWHKVYSFQREDCAEFGLRFNSTMYAPPPPGILSAKAEILCDVLFLGVPKDRLPVLRELHAQLANMGLRVFFRIGITDDKHNNPEQAPGWHITREWLDYSDYLCMVRQSRCLLDLYQSIQTGFSLRVMEHIYFGKKLITNNRVIKQAEFYHPNNIFILDEDDMQRLTDWLELPFVPAGDEIKDYYKFENWAGRFQ